MSPSKTPKSAKRAKSKRSKKAPAKKRVAMPRKSKTATQYDPSKPLATGGGKWEAVCLDHFEHHDKPVAQCVKDAGYSEKSAHVQASRMLKNVKFRARLEWLREQTAKKTIASVEERKEVLTRILRSVGNADPANYGHGAADGVWWNGFDDSEEMAEARGAIGGWKSRTTEDGSSIQEVKLRPYSEATGAIAELKRMDGSHAPTKIDATLHPVDDFLERLSGD